MNLNNVPKAGQTLNATQSAINTNFINIDTAFSVDHIGYTLAGYGKHTSVTMPQRAAPAVSDATTVGLYVASLSGKPELYINKSVANGGQIPCTAALKAAAGWTYLPSGILIQWIGGSIGIGLDTATVTFPISFNNLCLTCQVSAKSATSFDNHEEWILAVGTLTKTKAVINKDFNHKTKQINFNILAIGY